MYTIIHNRPASILALSLLLAVGAQADVPVEDFSFNFEQIRLDYRPASAGVPFAIDLVINADGSADGTLVGTHQAADVTLKRGVIASATPVGSLFELDYVDANRQALGRMAISSVNAGDFSFEVLTADRSNPDGTDSFAFHLDTAPLGEHIKLQFRGSEDAWLSGSPAEIFGASGTGKTLAAAIPVPAQGQALELTVEVQDRSGPAVRIPITVKHHD